jgi:anti-anti-sigma factor
MDSSGLRVIHEARENCHLFCLRGLFDQSADLTFHRAVDQFVSEEPRHFILDLTFVDFIDSSGLGAIVWLVKKVQGKGGTVQIVSHPRLTQTVRLVRLEKFLSLQDSVDTALENIREI